MRILKGCGTGCLVLFIVPVAGLLFLAETTTPVSIWLYQQNSYFQDLVHALHGPARLDTMSAKHSQFWEEQGCRSIFNDYCHCFSSLFGLSRVGSAHAAGTITVYLQVMDSCKQVLPSANFTLVTPDGSNVNTGWL